MSSSLKQNEVRHMKKFLIGLAMVSVFGLAIAFTTNLGNVAQSWAQNVLNYNEQGGARQVIGGALDIVSTGTLSVESSGTLDIESGGVFSINSVTVTASAAELNTMTGTTASTAEINSIADASARIVTIVATDAITLVEHANRINLMAEVGGDALVTLTMPEATGTGNRYKFYVGVVNTSNYVIAALTTDILQGTIMGTDSDGAPGNAWALASDDDKLTLDGTATGGASIGDWVELVDCLDTIWCTSGQITQTGGSEATPGSSS